MATSEKGRWVGARVRRREDPRLLTGRARYVDDIRLPETGHMCLVRSPHAHARILNIDVSAARSVPGVLVTLTGPEVAKLLRPFPTGVPLVKPVPYPVLPTERVRHFGEGVAAVVAESPHVAEDAAELVKVEYEPLPAVVDPRHALSMDAPFLYEDWGDNVLLRRSFSGGQVDLAFAQADAVLDETFTLGRQTGVPLEPRGCLAYDDGETLTVWSSTQFPHVLRTVLAEVLGLPEHHLRVIAPEVGGGFGIKMQVYREEALVALLTRLLRRPVKWREDIREHLAAAVHARDMSLRLQLAARKDGVVLAMRAYVTADMGTAAALPLGHGPVLSLLGGLPTAYKIENYSYEAVCLVTNKSPAGAYRGYGAPERVLALERALDLLAAKLGLDPADVRRRNLLTQIDLPYRAVTGAKLESGTYREAFELALDMAGYSQFRSSQTKTWQEGRYLGIGMACFAEPCAPSMAGVAGAWGAYESCTLRIEPDAKVTAMVGLSPQGQGHETMIAQVVADALSLDPDDIIVRHSDTAVAPYGLGAWASRGATVGGAAAVLAAEKIREKVLRIGAHLLEVSPSDLRIADGRVEVVGAADRFVTLRDVTRAAYLGRARLPAGMEPGLEATAFFDPPAIDSAPDSLGRMMRTATFSNAAHVATVEVFPETGEVKVLDYVVAHDCGRVINPTLVEGQVHGGVAQGIGGALYEAILYDDAGQLLTGSLFDYTLPGATEIPSVRVAHLASPCPSIPGGFKGMGEGGTIGAPAALANAIADALRPLGVQVRQTPLTPTAIRALIAAPPQRPASGHS